MSERKGSVLAAALAVVRAIRMSVMSILVIGLFIAFSLFDGAVTKADLMTFMASVITALSFGITFALAVLAINAYASYKELDDLKRVAESTRGDLVDRAINTDTLIAILQEIIETISTRLVQLSSIDEERDVSYFRLFQSRLFLKLMIESSFTRQVNICRDILGSMEPGDSPSVLERTVERLRELRRKLPEDRRTIDRLVEVGQGIIRLESENYDRLDTRRTDAGHSETAHKKSWTGKVGDALKGLVVSARGIISGGGKKG